MPSPRILTAVVITLGVLAATPVARAAEDLKAQAQLLMKSPDVAISKTFETETRSEVIDSLLGSPMSFARLWEAYGFTPLYKMKMNGTAIHVDDPTGITGDLNQVEHVGSKTVFVGTGNLNHAYVPAFRGKMALVLTTTPKPTGVSTRVDVYIRTESRILGLVTWTLFPLVRSRAEHRVVANAADIGTILKDLAKEPQKTAGRLTKQDATALLKVMPAQPAAPAKKQ